MTNITNTLNNNNINNTNSRLLVSPSEFHKVAKWSYCPYYGVNLKPLLFEENDIVFLNLDYFIQFIYLLNQNKPSNKFKLILHNSYNPFTYEHFVILYPLTTHIYTINPLIINTHITCIPIGFFDNKYISHKLFREILDKNKPKDILIYSNFLINTNKQKRIECLNAFVKKDWIYKDQFIPIEQYINKIYRSKYILCPEGLTIDTHRIYIALYYNTIPITIKNNMTQFYISLPILVVNSWDKVTKDFLETNYDLYYNKMIEWKHKNTNWTSVDFWLNK